MIDQSTVRCRLFVGAAAAIGMFPFVLGTTAERTPGLKGLWILNTVQSRTASGHTLPNWLVVNILQDDESGFRWKIIRRNADGSATTWAYAGATDGVSYGIEGASAGTMASFKRTSNGGFQMERHDKQGNAAMETCTLNGTKDGLACSGVFTPKDGAPLSYSEVLERIPDL